MNHQIICSWVHDDFIGFSYECKESLFVHGLFIGTLFYIHGILYYMKIQCTIVHKSSMDLLLLSGFTVTSTDGLTATHPVVVQ